jgi:golgi-specific brefeldin A-resistance guanine nucleotide exchange factor 1
MSSSGYLIPPEEDSPEKNELWNETWKRLDRFLPGLKQELFPEQVQKKAPVEEERKGNQRKSVENVLPERAETA